MVYVHHRQMYLTEIIALTAFTLLYTCTYVHKITSRQHKALRELGAMKQKDNKSTYMYYKIEF